MSQSKIKVITLFTGIGAQEAALKRLNIPFEVVGISEIDKHAIQSYEAINGPTFNYGDITKIPMLDYADLWTYSFPCQDLSVAGKQAGISEGTRSGLLLHVERLLETAVLLGNQPKYLLLENVKALVSKKFKPDFDRWLSKLDSLGYNNYWQVLNAKDYGVPQNRERVFVVSIRKDVDIKGYKFPEKIPLTRKLEDVSEPVVDEKYYLSQDKVDKLVMNMNVTDSTGAILSKYGTHLNKTTDVAGTLMARDYKGFGNQETNGIIEPAICASRGRNPENPSDRTAGAPTEQRLELNQTGCSNTITTVEKDNYLLKPQVLTPKRNEYGKLVRKEYEAGNFTDSRHNMTDMQPRHDGVSNTLTTVNKDNYVIQLGNIVNTGNWDNPQAGRVYSTDGISPTLNTMQGGQREPKILKNYRIRRLTPLECWRLMDFTDEEFYAAQLSGVSNSQLCKQAGNSIVVAVLQAIFKELLA
ncbi:MAG: DNA (cytosine-5-)-methyltransferase [Alphaproteobacteria bacterium]|nr:DNA (cytosine-5-)-methyltransferase [Alphaproteobacteria bacterium]MBR1600026.1 DNA (cytosine-5-)-methyltransferase [Alphaproteobacteria bacterium]MBR1601781.1 DNA (cytosine-5-)-methyltransferase [Alphaproteobacteria bacterium]